MTQRITPQSKDPVPSTIADLAANYDSLMEEARGFTIGRGKKLYRLLTPQGNEGLFKTQGYEGDDILGWPRFAEATDKITIHY